MASRHRQANWCTSQLSKTDRRDALQANTSCMPTFIVTNLLTQTTRVNQPSETCNSLLFLLSILLLKNKLFHVHVLTNNQFQAILVVARHFSLPVRYAPYLMQCLSLQLCVVFNLCFIDMLWSIEDNSIYKSVTEKQNNNQWGTDCLLCPIITDSRWAYRVLSCFYYAYTHQNTPVQTFCGTSSIISWGKQDSAQRSISWCHVNSISPQIT